MNMRTDISTDTERILAEALDFPDLVQDALNGDTSARLYLKEEQERLKTEGNDHAVFILSRILGKQ